MVRWFLAGLFLVTSIPSFGEDLHVAFWNVENLFDLEDDPQVEFDEDFTPEGSKRWTAQKLDRKLANVSRLISRMNAQKGPDILAVAEVENRQVIELLVERLKPLNRQYKIVHQDSPSGRGIDCAVIYDEAKLKCVGQKFLKVEGTEQPTRDVVEADLTTTSNETLYVFANHWPSRAHPESDREQAAKVLRTRVDEILKENGSAKIVALGDFNDFPPEPAMKDVLRTVEHVSDMQAGALLNTTWALARSGKGTYVYDNKWDVLDQIVVSPGLVQGEGWLWKEGSTRPAMVVDDQLFDPSGDAIPRPNRSYSGNKFHFTGYSDHLPIEAILTRP